MAFQLAWFLLCVNSVLFVIYVSVKIVSLDCTLFNVLTLDSDTVIFLFIPLCSVDDSMGFSFQLASVDERGTISFWVSLIFFMSRVTHL